MTQANNSLPVPFEPGWDSKPMGMGWAMGLPELLTKLPNDLANPVATYSISIICVTI
jgi:hypothetical protein